jgi:hypothetical protein
MIDLRIVTNHVAVIDLSFPIRLLGTPLMVECEGVRIIRVSTEQRIGVLRRERFDHLVKFI